MTEQFRVAYLHDLTTRKANHENLSGKESLLHRQMEELSAIYDLSLHITETRDLSTLLETIVKQATQLLKGTGGGFYLCDHDKQAAQCVVSYLTQHDFRGAVLKFGEGLTGQVAQTGNPMIIDDYRTWSGRAATYDEEQPFRAVISAPVIWQGQVTGVLHVLDDSGERLFTPKELKTLTFLANQAAVAIENARLLEGEHRRRQESETLRSATAALTSTLDLQGVLDDILTYLSKVISYDSATIFLLEGDHLHAKAARGLPCPETVIGNHFPADDDLFQEIFRTGQPLILEQAHKHPSFQGWGQTVDVGGWMGIPLIAKDIVIGYLTCDNQLSGAYKPPDADLAQAFANQAAIAIENARLFEAERAQLLLSQTLQEVGALLTSQLSLEEVLETILDLLARVVQFDSASIQLLHPSGTLKLAAGRGFADIERTRQIVEELSDHMLRSKLAELRALVIPDTYNDPRWAVIPGTEYIHAWAGAPLLVKGRLIGCLNVDSRTVNAYDEQTAETVMAFAQQAAIAIENARLFEQAQTERGHLRLLYDISQELTSSLDPDELLQRAVTLTSQALGGSVGQAYSYTPGEDFLRLRALYGRPFDALPLTDGEFTLPLGKGLTGQVAQKRKPIYLPDVSQATSWFHVAGVDDNIQSALGAPIQSGDRLLGVFTVLHRQPRAFSAEHLELMEAICQEVGLALSNSQRYQQIQIQERLATVGQLAAGIAHDFNNIMATILVYADLMRMDTSIQGVSQEKLEIIRQQIQRASSLIRQILDFSRRSVMEQSTLDLLPLVKELEKILVRTLPETIQIALSYESDNYLVKCDPTRLQQVFMNLALNARDAMPKGGKLKISLKKVQFSPGSTPPLPDMPPGNWVRITVSDTGVGIPSDVQEHIFDPFFTTKSVDEGTGLGLAQVYGIVKQHEGFIDFRSQIGAGTSFIIYLPAQRDDVEKAGAPESQFPQLDGRGLTVLVVEDDDITREALQALLSSHGFDVRLASDGALALQLLEKDDRVSLVVSDVVMPNLGGLELYKTLQERHPKIKMLLMTGHPLEEGNRSWLEKGEIRWLQKPFSAQELGQAITKLLEDQ
jgi:GAF domain-containing protein